MIFSTSGFSLTLRLRNASRQCKLNSKFVMQPLLQQTRFDLVRLSKRCISSTVSYFIFLNTLVSFLLQARRQLRKKENYMYYVTYSVRNYKIPEILFYQISIALTNMYNSMVNIFANAQKHSLIIFLQRILY